jgi:hypothetical protein
MVSQAEAPNEEQEESAPRLDDLLAEHNGGASTSKKLDHQTPEERLTAPVASIGRAHSPEQTSCGAT